MTTSARGGAAPDEPPVLATDRLLLVATPLEAAEACAAGDVAALEAALGARVPADWPPPGLAAEKPSFRDALAAQPDPPGFFGGFFILCTDCEPPELVGHIALHGPPDLEGALVVGYTIVASRQGRGYASEALRALCGWAFFRSDARAATAVVQSDNAASRRVLERCGFEEVGPAPAQPFPSLRYALTREKEAAIYRERMIGRLP